MLTINIFGDISSVLSFSHEGFNKTFSATQLQSFLLKHPNEKDIQINIHSDGGSVHEGLAIYDLLRNSGKNIYTNIVGACHSIATIILLAAPLENRSANKNARALIHQVRANLDSSLTFDELDNLKNDIEREQAEILLIYAERTNLDLKTLEEILLSEKIHTAADLLQMGFISKINSYNTNKKIIKMAAKDTNLLSGLINKISAAMKAKQLVNYDFKDAAGEVVFSTPSETDELNVGDTVTLASGETSGTFELEDGRQVIIEDNIVTDIVLQATPEEFEALMTEVETLRAENENFRELLNEAQTTLTNLMNDEGSNYKIRNRIAARQSLTKKKDVAKNLSKDELLAEARKKRDMFKNRKKVEV